MNLIKWNSRSSSKEETVSTLDSSGSSAKKMLQDIRDRWRDFRAAWKNRNSLNQGNRFELKIPEKHFSSFNPEHISHNERVERRFKELEHDLRRNLKDAQKDLFNSKKEFNLFNKAPSSKDLKENIELDLSYVYLKSSDEYFEKSFEAFKALEKLSLLKKEEGSYQEKFISCRQALLAYKREHSEHSKKLLDIYNKNLSSSIEQLNPSEIPNQVREKDSGLARPETISSQTSSSYWADCEQDLARGRDSVSSASDRSSFSGFLSEGEKK